MSEELFIKLINKLEPEVLNQELVCGLYALLNSNIDKKIKQAAYDKLNEWKAYKRKLKEINKTRLN